MSTELISQRYAGLDLWPTRDAVQAMLEGQLAAAAAVQSQAQAIAAAAEAAADRLRGDGLLRGQPRRRQPLRQLAPGA